ncbi:MAG TPA: site-specific integrase [Sideroxyarcus sp.]|nr:site-specific integrase [Sideroxyarcus sp.]
MPLLSEAATEYRRHLVARGRSEGTAQGRYNTLKTLIRIIGDRPCSRVEPRHVDDFFSEHPHWCAGTRNNQLYNLTAFFEWCRFRRYMSTSADPCHGWRKEFYAIPPKLYVPVSEWPRLFHACQTPLETVTLATGLYLFLRASEQQQLLVKHVHLDRHEVDIYRRKVRDYDTMPIPAELAPYLRAHLTHMAEEGHAHPDSHLVYARTTPRVVAGRQGFVPGTTGVNPSRPHGRPYLIVKGILERAGYDTHQEGEHTLRRSGARAYFDTLVADGYDGALRRVMSMLGHRNSRNTETYLGLSLDRHRRNHDLRGKPMFPQLQDARIIPLWEEK